MEKRIVCAANRFTANIDNNLVTILILGARHWDNIMCDMWHTLDNTIISHIDRNTENQGFIDQFGNFLSRKEAFKIAKENGQIIRDLGNTDELYSEHLY